MEFSVCCYATPITALMVATVCLDLIVLRSNTKFISSVNMEVSLYMDIYIYSSKDDFNSMLNLTIYIYIVYRWIYGSEYW